MIPTLLNDLHVIYKLERKLENRDIPSDSPGEECQGKSNDCQPSRKAMPVLDQDLNCHPYEDDTSESLDNELYDDTLPG